MANILMGLSGLFGGAAQGYGDYRDRAMRDMLFRAQLAQMGGGTKGDVVGNADPVSLGLAPGLGSSAPNMSQVAQSLVSPQGAPPPQAPSGQQLAGALAPTPSIPTGGAPPSAPTNQADVFRQVRAVNDATPAQAPPPVGNNFAPPGSGAASFAAAAQGPAPATAPSGAPTPGTAPTGVDPIGGINSGLSDLASRYIAATPHGIVDLGHGMAMDLARSPQAMELRKGMLDVLARAQEQQNLFTQQGKLETTREGFEAGQQANTIGSQQTISANQLAQNERDAARNVNLRMAELRSEREWRETMLGVGQNKTATAALDKSLSPYETQASTIKSALAELDLARTHPAATDAARISTAMAQVAAASPRLNEGLADLAGKGMDPSVAGTWQRFFGTATGGVSPAKQIDDAQAVLKGEMNAVHQNWSTAAMATLSSHPEISDGPTRLATREGVYFPGSSAPNTGGSTMVIGPRTRAAAADPKDPNHAAAVRMIQQAAAQGSP